MCHCLLLYWTRRPLSRKKRASHIWIHWFVPDWYSCRIGQMKLAISINSIFPELSQSMEMYLIQWIAFKCRQVPSCVLSTICLKYDQLKITPLRPPSPPNRLVKLTNISDLECFDKEFMKLRFVWFSITHKLWGKYTYKKSLFQNTSTI